jgi:hypothetical protein
MKRILATVALFGMVVFGAGCWHMRGGLYVPAAPLVRAAADVAVTAAIVGTAIAVTTHDAHVHWENCGCQRQWYQGHWVYWYGGWWEYQDPSSGYWYHY